MQRLSECASESEIVALLERVKGPWAIVYWQAEKRRLWFGRDGIGRRSLLIHRPKNDVNDCFILSSVGILASSSPGSNNQAPHQLWDELPITGLYCVDFSDEIPSSQSPSPERRDECHEEKQERDKIEDAREDSEEGEEGEEGDGMIRHVSSTRFELANVFSFPVEHHARTPTPKRKLIDPKDTTIEEGREQATQQLLQALSQSVKDRVKNIPPVEQDETMTSSSSNMPTSSRLGVLFSGGLDSTVLARLADLHLPPGEPIDLMNVAFAEDKEDWMAYEQVPDRLTGLRSWKELCSLSPSRRFNFIEVNVTAQELDRYHNDILDILVPSESVMDHSIAAAMWFASLGEGIIRSDAELLATIERAAKQSTKAPPRRNEKGRKNKPKRGGRPRGRRNTPGDEQNAQEQPQLQDQAQLEPDAIDTNAQPSQPEEQEKQQQQPQQRYRSTVKVLFIGSGADEQLGGYARHRQAFIRSGWQGLQSELEKDINRIWKRNLGRDDRVIASTGREARTPYLSEEVTGCLNSLPLWHVCDMAAPPGEGDKAILRRVGRELGLKESTRLVKRAIQFGSRIAKVHRPQTAVLLNNVPLHAPRRRKAVGQLSIFQT
ncbi:Asparagine synthetase domain-containing protein 1 [Balamuthia mandrillaris]